VITPIHSDLVKYIFENDTEIICTFDHPFYVNGLNLSSFSPNLTNERYKLQETVSEIKIGDFVNLNDESTTRIIDIQKLDEQPTQTYIFEVTKNHNFYANGVLTHNKACFIAGTKVLTANGVEKNIEDLQVGEEVLSYNEYSNIIESKKIVKMDSPIHDDLVEYTLSNGVQIISTFDHPYYVDGLKLASYKPDWTNERYDLPSEVIRIDVGDKLFSPNRDTVEILSIKELENKETQTYIISVEDNRNFYANGVLVHNK
jgi:intein/homing endonuclease